MKPDRKASADEQRALLASRQARPQTRPDGLPSNRLRCMVCGSCLELDRVTMADGAKFRAFLRDHNLCRALHYPSAQCTAGDCTNTGVGPAQRCPDHGGKWEAGL